MATMNVDIKTLLSLIGELYVENKLLMAEVAENAKDKSGREDKIISLYQKGDEVSEGSEEEE